MEKDEPAKDGTVGRIVVTDLFNKATPFIRYDTGDVGVMGKEINPSGNMHRVLRRIDGRKLDLLAGKNGWISPHTIDYALRKFPFLNQFQLIQHDFMIFTLNVKLHEGQSSSSNSFALATALRPYLGDKVKIQVKEVENIPISTSGKYRMVLNEINQKQLCIDQLK